MKLHGLLSVALLAACGSHASTPQPGATAGQHGIYVADLDRSVDPCTDFYEFSNGTWRKENPIPAEMQRWSRRWKAGEDAKDRLKNILAEVSAKTDWPKGSVEQQVGDFYAGCMDQAAIDARGLAPIQPMLDEINAVREPRDLGRTIARLHAVGVNVPFGIYGTSDLHTPTNVVAWAFAGGLGLPDRDYYVKTEPRFVDARAKYVVFVADMFKLAGKDEATAKKAAETVMAFETALAKASLDNVALRDPSATDHLMPVAELQKLTPSFDWSAYLQAQHLAAWPVNVTEPAFFAEFERQLKTTPIADWKTYLSWQLINDASNWLPQPFVDANFGFYAKYLAGTKENKPRWKQCVEAADRQLGDALGKKYVEKYFSPAAKARMQLLVKNVLAAMHDTIEKLDWMSPATKQRALEKLSTFYPKIGYPDRWLDYSSVAITRDKFWESLLAARAWNVNDNHGQVGKPIERWRWGMTASTSDASYNPSLNEITFPAGILQPPAFSVDNVDAVNYGAIGVVIGHEISHGFDDQGARFDAQGRLDNWWTKEDLAKFTQKGQCVADQFERYFIEPDIHHNGKLVLGESIGDLGGVNLAYRAFQKAQQQTPAPTIDGFTPNQQFFIAWGQFRSDAIRPETQRLMIQSDPHPIAKYRVMGPLSNSAEFQAAFSCKANSAMVRPVRCDVW